MILREEVHWASTTEWHLCTWASMQCVHNEINKQYHAPLDAGMITKFCKPIIKHSNYNKIDKLSNKQIILN